MNIQNHHSKVRALVMDIRLVSKYLLGILLFSLTMVAQAAPDLVVSTVSGSPGSTVTVPIAFVNNGAGNVVAMDFKLHYDPAILTVNTVDYSALGGNISSHNNNAAAGIITFLVANNPLQATTSGNILVTFAINNAAVVGSTSNLSIQNVTFSDATANSVAPDNITNASISIVATTQAIPTLSQWGLILLSLMMILLASPMVRLRK